MAKLVAAFGTSHSTMLFSSVDHWIDRFDDIDRKAPIHDFDGAERSFDWLLDHSPPDAEEKLSGTAMKRRHAQTELQELQSRRNEVSRRVGDAMKRGNQAEAEELKTAVGLMKARMEALEGEAAALGSELDGLLASLPNLPADEVPEGAGEAENQELLRWGAGPRAGQQLVLAAKARAALQGREAVSIADVRALTPAVLRHRLVPSFAAHSRGVGADELLTRVLEAVPI